MSRNISSDNIPYSQEAEEALLGAILIDPDALASIVAQVQPEDFYLVRTEHVFRAMLRVHQRDERVDYVTLQDELRAMGKLDEIGGTGYLTQLVNNAPSAAHATVYAQLIVRAAARRAMLAAADEIRALAVDETLTLDEAYRRGMQAYDAIQPNEREYVLPGHRSIARYDEIVNDLIERRDRGELLGYPLPPQWNRLAEALPAVYPGDFVVVSGAPGSGKSAFLETWAEHSASLQQPVHYIHTEMSTEQLLHRRMARHSGVPYHMLASGQAAERYDKLLDADTRIDTWSSYITYHWMPDVPFQRLAAALRRAAQSGVKFFFIDHFQDVQPMQPRGMNEVRAFEEMCVWLAAFAEYRRAAVIVASQQNEDGKTKWTKKLIEKAVVWLSIKRERLTSDYDYTLDGTAYRSLTGEDSPVADIFINKARFGRKAKVRMLYHGPRFCWLDMSRVRRPSYTGKVVSLDDLKARAQQTAESEVGS